MNYQIKTGAKRVILDVLAGADASLVGISIENCNIVQIPANEFLSLACTAMGIEEKHLAFNSIFSHRAYPKAEEQLIVLETVEKNDTPSFLREAILEALKLYKAADVYSCYWFSYRYDTDVGKLYHGSLGKICHYEHAYNEVPGKYTLTEIEKEEFPIWFELHRGLFTYKLSQRFREMKRLYFDSYLIGKANPAFIMLFVVFEMLYGGDERDGILQRIKEGVSSLLGKNSNEKHSIKYRLSQLYDERSKYVHDGESVDWKSLFLLRDYVRRVLVKLYETDEAQK